MLTADCAHGRPARMSWARLLRRVFDIDILRCPNCGAGELKIIAAIEIALWDIKATVAGMPLYRLLGGVEDTVGVYASAVNLHLTQDELLAQIEDQLSQGYTTFKIKIGRDDPVEDLERMRAVRKLIGPSRALLLDVNQRWSSGEALVKLRALAEVNPGWIEEPMPWNDVAGHAHLRRTSAFRLPSASNSATAMTSGRISATRLQTSCSPMCGKSGAWANG